MNKICQCHNCNETRHCVLMPEFDDYPVWYCLGCLKEILDELLFHLHD